MHIYFYGAIFAAFASRDWSGNGDVKESPMLILSKHLSKKIFALSTFEGHLHVYGHVYDTREYQHVQTY